MNDNEYPRDPRTQPVLDLSDKSIRSSILKDLSRNFNADYQNKLLKGYDEPLLSKEKAEAAYKAGGLAELEKAKRQEAESILAPSVFDEEWAKENDPEEYGRMQKAKSLDDAMNLALGVEGSTKYVNLGLPQMRKIANLMGKNPTERQLAEAADLRTGESLSDYIERRKQELSTLDFVTKERLGISHDTPEEQILEEVKKAHTGLTGEADIPVKIIDSPGQVGAFYNEGSDYIFTSEPKYIKISDPKYNPAGVLEHELGHVEDAYIAINPPYSREIVPINFEDFNLDNYLSLLGKQDQELILEKLLALNPKLNTESARFALEKLSPPVSIYDSTKEMYRRQGKSLLDYLNRVNKNILSLQDISKAGHHFRYPRNFEIQRSIELLDPNKPFSVPSLSENARILKEVRKARPETTKEAVRLYREKGFPNIENIIKEKARVDSIFKEQLE
jgi:hypothetical protein